jgi:hypothetical protein
MRNATNNTANNLVADITFLAEHAPGAASNRKLKGAARYAAKRARLDSLKNGRKA